VETGEFNCSTNYDVVKLKRINWTGSIIVGRSKIWADYLLKKGRSKTSLRQKNCGLKFVNKF
jgi:hypothetical protein